MSESYSLPTESEAGPITKDGQTVAGHTGIAAVLERDLRLGLPLEVRARHAFVSGDIAEFVLDWSIDGTGPDGEHVHLGTDGVWRYIDNNQGTAVRQPA